MGDWRWQAVGDVAAARGVRRLEGHSDLIACVALSPDGRWALTGGGRRDASEPCVCTILSSVRHALKALRSLKKR